MANPQHLDILRKGAEVWNMWREENASEFVDLSQAELQGQDLVQVKLADAQLAGARLNGAVLAQADLRNADLRRANLSGSDLTNADLRQASLVSAAMFRAELTAARLDDANLRGAFLIMADLKMTSLRRTDLSEAYLMNVTFAKAKLSQTVFHGARMESTVFADVDLDQAIDLDEVIHSGPSTIGIDTVYRSRGAIPEGFLRGAGVPEDLIVYARSLIGQPGRFNSCFISYAAKDQDFADCLHRDLQAHGVRCWFAPHNIRGGRKIQEQIEEAIRSHDRLLLILSETSISSDWVNTEISNARQREAKERKRILFPIRLVEFEEIKRWKCIDPDTGKDTAREIREYFVPDFSNWREPDSYRIAFERLLRDLRAD